MLNEMFEELLDFCKDNNVYVTIKGITPAGVEKTIEKSENKLFWQADCVFTVMMVENIVFNQYGATVTLKH